MARLQMLHCYDNQLLSLYPQGSSSLGDLRCYNNSITNLQSGRLHRPHDHRLLDGNPTIEDYPTADMDGDGYITIADVTALIDCLP